VIPTYQNPTGSVMSALARQRVAGAGIPVIEDEVPADLRFPGEALPTPIAAYSDSVISIGSLSKSIWGGLRIGWIRATPPLINRLARLRAVHDLGGNVPTQLAAVHLLPLLDAPALATTLKSRHDHLRGLLTQHLPTWDIPEVTGGQCLWVRLPFGDGTSFAQAALRHGLAVLPGAGLDVTGTSDAYIRLHFRARPPDLTEAVHRLTTTWSAYHPPAVRVPRRPAIAI
jgi:DNA-binding transcriptional MocR family regulator